MLRNIIPSLFALLLTTCCSTIVAQNKTSEEEAHDRFTVLETYYNNDQDSAFMASVEDEMEFMRDNEQWYYYFATYHLKISRIIFKEDTQLGIEMAQAMYDDAVRVNYDLGIGGALINLARGYIAINRNAEATKFLEDAMKILDKYPRSTFRYSGYWQLSRQYAYDFQIEELLALMQQWEREIEQLIAEGDSPDDYLDEYNEIYQGYSKAYIRIGEPEKAVDYLEKARPFAEQRSGGTRRQLWNLEVNIYYELGQYEKLLPLVDSIYNSAVADGQNYTAVQMLHRKARVYALLENAPKTELYYEHYMDEKDSIAKYNLDAQLSEMRARYEVDRHIREKQRNHNYFLLAAVGFLLAVMALIIWILYSRRLASKNQVLIERIREHDRLQEQLQACSTARKAMLPPTETDELYERIRQIVENERAFVDPSLNRNSLAQLVGSNETYARKCILRNTGQTVNDYLNGLRLRYARELLADRTLTIEAVALESGFGSRSTFHIIFKREYGLTPDEFRRFAE